LKGLRVATTSGELREILIEAITAVRSKQLGSDDAKAIALLAQQVSASLAAEVDCRRAEVDVSGGRVALIGQLILGEQEIKK
jgi:hypothetical protein